MAQSRKRSPRNKTIRLSEEEVEKYKSRLKRLTGPVQYSEIVDHTICQDVFEVLDWLPQGFVDLLFADPPYNLDKTFNEHDFSQRSLRDYEIWLDTWIIKIQRVLKPTASIYICGDWRSSAAIHRA